MIIDRVEIKDSWVKKLKNDLQKDRYEHTIRVCETAYYLAIVHKVSMKKAVKAAFLHDCAKCISLGEQLRICRKYGYKPTKYEMRNSGLLHSKTGMVMAKHLYSEDSKKVLDAIKYHTTGRPDMGRIEKIVFISDFIEPGRNFKFDINYIVEAAFSDLDLCVYYILDMTMKYLKNKSKVFDPMTTKTYNYYKKVKEAKYGKN